MNNNNKRKNRPSQGGGSGGGNSGNSGMSRFANDNRQMNKTQRPQAQGIYNNARFMHGATALVGNVVQMHLRSGNIYEGVFRTFSQNFDVALELPSCIKSNKNALDDIKAIPNFMIFPLDTVVSIAAKDFDSQYATVGAFQIDAAISENCNGVRLDERELEPWDATGMNGEVEIGLDEASNGWDANDMFRKNENAFGVQSTFDDSLSAYTMPLDKIDTDEFKEQEAIAEKLAAEIENNPISRERLDIEDGDEEAMFAAVTRPNIEVERDRERQREKDAERERERDRETEKERERDRQRERDRDRDDQREQRSMVDRKNRYETTTNIISERYITKPTRNTTGPPPPVAMSTQSMGSVALQRGTHNTHERDTIADRNERVLSGNSTLTSVTTNSTQTIGVGNANCMMSGSVKNSITSSSQMNNQMQMQQDSGGKQYGGGSIIKRKPSGPQGQKMARNVPTSNSSNGPSGMSQSGGNTVGGNNSINSGIGNSGGGGGGNKNPMYQNISVQQQSSYSNYSSTIHNSGPSQYRGPPKLNGDTSSGGGGKPLPQRTMRQYSSGSSSNSSMNYNNDSSNQSRHNSSHGMGHNVSSNGQHAVTGNSNSPPLQTGGSGAHGVNVQPPQPQRQIRSRDPQLQDLRQFGQDFQLANSSTSPGLGQTSNTNTQTPQQNQPQHLGMSGGKNHHPQPSVSPPQQQQQQMQHLQQQHLPTTQQHVTLQHMSQQHHTGVAAQQQQQTQQFVPSHMQQQPQQNTHTQQQATQKSMQHIQQQQQQQQPLSVVSQNVTHNMTHQHQVQQQQHIGQQINILPEQGAQVSPPHQPQQIQALHANVGATTVTGNHNHGHNIQNQHHQQQQQQQTSPVIIENATLPITNQQQQHTQHQPQTSLISNKVENSSPLLSTSVSNAPNVIDKHTSPPLPNNNNIGTTGSNSSSNTSPNSVTAAPVKKTHVLNPSAKPFTPRSPSTPNASRPHTPQTPVPLTTIYTANATLAATAVPGQQTPVYMMQSQQTAAAFHAPAHPQAGQQPRMRRSNYGPMTPSQLHASAATGQPLLATAPLPTQFIPYPQTPHAPHFQSQPYAPTMVRMYEPQPLQFLTQTPPSTTPSPGQPHQTFHPQPQPSPAGGGPQPAFGPQSQPQYHVMCPLTLHPTQLMPSAYYPTAAPQHPQQGQQFQILMSQHPAQ